MQDGNVSHQHLYILSVHNICYMSIITQFFKKHADSLHRTSDLFRDRRPWFSKCGELSVVCVCVEGGAWGGGGGGVGGRAEYNRIR